MDNALDDLGFLPSNHTYYVIREERNGNDRRYFETSDPKTRRALKHDIDGDDMYNKLISIALSKCENSDPLYFENDSDDEVLYTLTRQEVIEVVGTENVTSDEEFRRQHIDFLRNKN